MLPSEGIGWWVGSCECVYQVYTRQAGVQIRTAVPHKRRVRPRRIVRWDLHHSGSCVAWMNAPARPGHDPPWTTLQWGTCRDASARLARLDECRLGGALECRAATGVPLVAVPGGARGFGGRRAPAVRLQQHPLRHEHPHRGVGPRQDDPLCAVDAWRRSPHLGLRLGSQAPPPPLPVAAAGERPRRDGRAPRGGRPGRGPLPRRGDRDPRHPQGRGRGRHADRGRHHGAADAGRPERGGRHGPRWPAGDARRAGGEVGRRDPAAQHRLCDGRRRLPGHIGATETRRP